MPSHSCESVPKGLFTAFPKEICYFKEKPAVKPRKQRVLRRRVSTELAADPLSEEQWKAKLKGSPLMEEWAGSGHCDAELVFAVKKWDSAVFANNKDVDWQIGALAADFGRRCRQISFTGCAHLTDKGLARLTERCPNLRKLFVTCAPHVSDDAIIRLTGKCLNLEFLYLSENAGLTEASFVHCAENCLRLKKVYMNSDQPQCKAAIRQLCDEHSHVKMAK
jgi:hypothetical protein